MKLLATNLVLYLFILPSALYLIMKSTYNLLVHSLWEAQLYPMSQFFSKAQISSLIVFLQFSSLSVSWTFHYILIYNICTKKGSTRSLKLSYVSKNNPLKSSNLIARVLCQIYLDSWYKNHGQLLPKKKCGRKNQIYGKKINYWFLGLIFEHYLIFPCYHNL